MTTPTAASFFQDKTWLIYGRIALSKAEATQAITSRGGRLVSSVSKKLQYLVWDGESLGAGDTVSAVKASDALAVGAIVVSEADFKSLLDGQVSDTLAAIVARAAPAPTNAPATEAQTPTPPPATAQTAAAKAGSMASSKKASDDALTPEALLTRTLEAIAASDVHRNGERMSPYGRFREMAATVEGAAGVCLAAGRGDLARAMIEALEPEMAAFRVRLALAGVGDLNAALDVTLAGVRQADRANGWSETLQGWAVARALALTADPALDARKDEVVAEAEHVIDGFFEGTRTEVDFGAVLETLLRNGQVWQVRRLVEKFRWRDPNRVGDMLKNRPTLAFAFVDDVAAALSLLNHIEQPWDRGEVASPAFLARAVAAGWSFDALNVLVHMAPQQRWAARVALTEAGRIEDGRRILADAIDQCTAIERLWRAEVLGDTAHVARVLAEPTKDIPLSLERVARGVEDFETTWRRLSARASDGSLMASVMALDACVRFALKQKYPRARYAPLLDTISALILGDFRTPYDVGVELDRRVEWARLKAAVATAEGDPNGERAGIETTLADFKALSAFGRDSYQRNEAAKAIALWAIEAKAPELAVKAADKVSKGERYTLATRVALGFLPDAPGPALAAFDRLAGDRKTHDLLGLGDLNASHRVDGSDRTCLLAALWAAVLAT